MVRERLRERVEFSKERERELKGRVPVASHAAAGGGQSNHAEVPRFNLSVCV